MPAVLFSPRESGKERCAATCETVRCQYEGGGGGARKGVDFEGGGGQETSAVLSRFTRPRSVHANNPRGACVHVHEWRGGEKNEEWRGLCTRETRPAKSFSRAASDSRYNFGPEET